MSQDEVSVGFIMRKKVPVVAPEDTVGTVASMMANSDVPGVLVVDDGELLGIITESDIVTRKAEVELSRDRFFSWRLLSRWTAAAPLESGNPRRCQRFRPRDAASACHHGTRSHDLAGHQYR